MLTPTGSVFRGAADRGYVEPEPMVFARLAHLTDSTISGLDAFGMLSGGILHVGTGGADTIYVKPGWTLRYRMEKNRSY